MSNKKVKNHMAAQLDKFNKKKTNITAVHALNEDIVGTKKKEDIINLVKKKESIDDTHSRSTFWVRKDLIKRLNNISENRRGFKKDFINYVIEQGLEELENNMKK